MKPFAFALNSTSHEQDLAWWNDGYSDAELKAIDALGEAAGLMPATVGDMKIASVNNGIRDSQVGWITQNEKSEWLFERLGFQIRRLNMDFYGFDLWGFDTLQYTVYDAAVAKPEGAHYDWHVDSFGRGALGQRKLSFVLQLADPLDYEGGDLEVMARSGEVKAPKERGLLYAFPSYMRHRVTKVTKGVRRTLVGWTLGPQLR